MMNLATVNLDLERAGTWPTTVKATVIFILCVTLGGLWYYFDTQTQLGQLDEKRVHEVELKATFEMKQKKAANLDSYKKQLEQIEQTFGDLLRQLPNKTEVPDLLVDVSQTGLASGLEFELFKPGQEVNKEFYAELPIQIRVLGNYLEFGAFITELASLPRIVTIHNVKIKPRPDVPPKEAGVKKKDDLIMEAVVKTYRYLDETTVVADKGKESAHGKKSGKRKSATPAKNSKKSK